MILYIKKNDIYSDIARIVLIMKGANAKFIDIDAQENKEYVEDLETIALSTDDVPILTTEHSVLHNLNLIIEAVEDLYPFPPMFPVFPKQRANARILLQYVDKVFLQNIQKLNDSDLDENQVSDIKLTMQDAIIETYKVVVRERETNAESNPDAQNVNVLTLVMTFVFYYFIKFKIAIPTKDKSLIDEIKSLIIRPDFIRVIKEGV